MASRLVHIKLGAWRGGRATPVLLGCCSGCCCCCHSCHSCYSRQQSVRTRAAETSACWDHGQCQRTRTEDNQRLSVLEPCVCADSRHGPRTIGRRGPREQPVRAVKNPQARKPGIGGACLAGVAVAGWSLLRRPLWSPPGLENTDGAGGQQSRGHGCRLR